MEGDIRDVVSKFMVKVGRVKALKLFAKETGRTTRTIARWIEGDFPDGHYVYLVALACGETDNSALSLGRRHSENCRKDMKSA